MASCYWNIAATPDIDPGFWPYSAALETKLARRFAGFRFNSTKAMAHDAFYAL